MDMLHTTKVMAILWFLPIVAKIWLPWQRPLDPCNQKRRSMEVMQPHFLHDVPGAEFLPFLVAVLYDDFWYIVTTSVKKVKGKGFPYSIPSVGPGADAVVQAVSPQVTISHPLGGRLRLLSARPAVTSPAAQHHRRLASTKIYCLVLHRCIILRVVTQHCLE